MERRIWVLWAIALTALSAVVTVRLVRLRRRLMSMLEDGPAPESDAGGGGGGGGGGGQGRVNPLLLGDALRLVQDEATVAHASREQRDRDGSSGSSLRRQPSLSAQLVQRLWWSRNLRAMVCSVCALLEGTFGWITGSAWTQAVSTLTFLNAYPDLMITFWNVVASMFTSTFAVAWLVYVAEDPFQYDDDKKVHRSAVEKFFLTNAMSFFVGFSYISWMRDLATLAGQELKSWGVFAPITVVTLFGPVLTLLFLWAKNALITRFAKLGTKGPGTYPLTMQDSARGHPSAANEGGQDSSMGGNSLDGPGVHSEGEARRREIEHFDRVEPPLSRSGSNEQRSAVSLMFAPVTSARYESRKLSRGTAPQELVHSLVDHPVRSSI